MAESEERVLSVFELAQQLKRTVEDATEGRWVEGEVGRLVSPTSGHVYFKLKDEARDATVDCVMYKRDAMRFGKLLSEGARVQLKGRATFYPPRGSLQWIAQAARRAGQGALLEALEKLKRKLVEEGLTDPQRKKPLPDQPRTVGVVTSRTGAAFADICSVALRRGAVRILLSPATVQGDGAVVSLLRAIDLLERAAPDVIIVGRGGGSAEDLMAFNDERVVRRIAACRIPTVSAVGHEIDVTLTDLVADARAATPSQAAEMVVPDAGERLLALRRVRNHLARAMRSRLTEMQLELDRAHRRLGDPRYLVANAQQELDGLRLRLARRTKVHLAKGREELDAHTRKLYSRHPRAVIAGARADLAPLRLRLSSSVRRTIALQRSALAGQGAALSALSPLSVLGRGYALVTQSDGRAARDVHELAVGADVAIRLRRGTFSARVQKVLSTVENHSSFDHESASASAEGDEGS